MTTADAFTLFDTPIGHCGIAWRAGAVTGVQLPDGPETATRARMRRRFPTASESLAPAEIQPAIEAIRASLCGLPSDVGAIVLDMNALPEFERSVYEVARTIAPGTTLTYGEVAARVGDPGAARRVGQVLGRNPFAPVVPCHRVVSADGRMHGFSASGGVHTKLRLLQIEGYEPNPGPSLFD
jgi:methylated-DNA-[protein]-cysteine S-methyltransferase